MLQNRFQIITLVMILLSLNLVLAIPSVILGKSKLTTNVNSSQYWDNLDNPSDILLNDLGDVEVSSPSNNQVVTWDSATSRWIAKDMVGAENESWNENYANTLYAKYQFVNNNFNGSGKITTTNNITAGYYCNSTNCYSLAQFLNYTNIWKLDVNTIKPINSLRLLQIGDGSDATTTTNTGQVINYEGDTGIIIRNSDNNIEGSLLTSNSRGALILKAVTEHGIELSTNNTSRIILGVDGKANFRGNNIVTTGNITASNIGVGVTNPLYPLQVNGSLSVINGNIGIGTVPWNYNNAGFEYVLDLGRSFYDETNLTGKKSISSNIIWAPNGTGSISQYILGTDASVDTNPLVTMNNANPGYFIGGRYYVQHRSNSSIYRTYGLAIQSGTYNSGFDTKGNITINYGLYLQGLKTPSSTINNAYGIFIEGMNGSINNYDLYISDAGSKNYLAGYTGFGTTTPLYPIQVGTSSSSANQSISIFASANISATGFITRTSVYDKSKGSALDLIKDSDTYKNRDGSINHSSFYGYVGGMKDTDYSRPVSKEVCPPIDETTGKPKSKCQIVTTYPYTINVEGVELGAEVDLLRQGIVELKTENERIKQCAKNSKTWEDYKLCLI